MILRGWHIDGFGLLTDHRQEGLGQGLTVIHGPNEAGKSSLLAFIRGVLFGFPDGRAGRSVPLYESVRGGSFGGRLFIESGGQSYTIARHRRGRRPATITDENGIDLPEGELRQLLGGADATLFRNVFGFSLTELQTLDTLTEENVRDRIFSGAVAGAGRSARDATKALESEAGALYKSHGGAKKNKIAGLLDELRQVEDTLREAKAAALSYPEKVEAERSSEAEVERLRQALQDIDARKGRLEALLRLWECWTARENALDFLERSGRAGPFERARRVEPDSEVEDLARRAQDLGESVKLQRDRLDRQGTLETQIAEARNDLQQALDNLGSGWTAERVDAFRLDIPTREEVQSWDLRLATDAAALKESQERLSEAGRQRDGAQERVEDLSGELEALGEAPPPVERLQERQHALEDLRVELGERDRMSQEIARREGAVTTEAERLDDLRAQRPGTGGYAVAAVAGALGIALGGWSVWNGEAGAAVSATLGVVVGVAIVLVALGLFWSSLRGRRALDARLAVAGRTLGAAERAVQSARLGFTQQEGRLATAARAQGLASDAPSDGDVSRAVLESQHEMERRREWENRKRRLDEAQAAHAKAEQAVETATQAVEQAEAREAQSRADWQDWKETRGFPEHLGPQGVIDFAAEVREARRAREVQKRHAAALAEQRATAEAWESAAREILQSRGHAPDTKLAEMGGEDLILAFTAEAAAIRDEQAAYREAAKTEADVDREAGSDTAKGDALRAALASAAVDDWRAELDQLQGTRAETEQEWEAAVRESRDAVTAREAVERSDLIAEMDTRRNTLLAEISETYRRWQTLTAACALIEQTLEAYERERQPAVFTSAGESFARVTGGRYPRIMQDEGGQGFDVLDNDGKRIRPIDLSRGTQEQLYLAVRLGLVEEFSRRGTSLPLVMDEILVNFDPERMAAMTRELVESARAHQVLLFTCHPFIVEMAQKADPTATVISLESRELEQAAAS